jgi:hypothetical protein
MKQVLIVSPSFPPISAADLHRVRTSAPFYAEFGWQPIVLAVSPEAHGGLVEADLVTTVPRGTTVIRTGALPVALTRPFGIGNVALRALPHLYAGGAAAIREYGPDLVYFSTTMFPAVALGRIWKSQFGTPYVVDMQDAWKTEYRGAGAQTGVKARLARAMHGILEPFAMKRVDGITAVSPVYAETLRQRYEWIHDDMCATIPFGATAADGEAAQRMSWTNTFFDRTDGRLHGVAVGRGGADLSVAAEILFRALRIGCDRGDRPDVHLSFIGTDYASDERCRTIAPIAEAVGVPGLAEEWPARVPYLDGLRLLGDAHFSVMLGSDDPGYSPSKVYPYLMTGRPFVAVMHASSPVVPLLRQSGIGVVATFESGADCSAAAARLASELCWVYARAGQTLAAPASLVESISARELTRRQCLAFDAAIRHASPEGIPCVE